MNYADEPSQAALERASQDVYDVIASQQGVCVKQGCSGAGTRWNAVLANKSRNGAPANVVGHRWNANTEAFRQITLYSLG